MACNCGSKSDIQYRVTFQGQVITASGGGDFPDIGSAQAKIRQLGGGQLRAVRAK